MNKSIFFSLILASFVCSQCSTKYSDVDFSFQESYSVKKGDHIFVSLFDGSIKALAADIQEVSIHYAIVRKGKVLDLDKEQLEKDYNVAVEVVPMASGLQIEIEQTGSWFSFSKEVQVNLKIQLPSWMSSEFRSSDGNIHVSGMRANVIAQTNDGDVYLSNLEGDVSGSTHDGDLKGEKIKGKIDFSSGDGNISLEAVRGDTHLETGDGNIQARETVGKQHLKTSDGNIQLEDVIGSFELTTSDGNISGEVSQLKGSLSATTSDGNIQLILPKGLGLNLDIVGESLDVPLTNFSGESNEESIKGKIHGGGEDLKLRTSDGNISISYR